jgi:uncharacterized protein (DUF608 family)
MLKALWPKVRKALEFTWIPGGWDADKDGVMEGCQHNTMDVEYYGPNPEIGVWYLGALRAAEEMARYLGQKDFADECRRIFLSGRRWLDENLFNGEYYEHQIRPVEDESKLADALRLQMGAKDLKNPDFQIGAGCLADQLVGQYMAHVCGLGYLLDPQNIRKTLRSIMKYNFKKDLRSHFNCLRSYALGDEGGLLVASYPKGRRPKRPFPYFSEVWTGLEYTAAVGMLYEGQIEDALKIIKSARDRHDGRKRNPFDEPECGHHYARAMASWAAVPAMTGFYYSAVEQHIVFAPALKGETFFWSNGDAWGTVNQKQVRNTIKLKIAVLHGKLSVRRLSVTGEGAVELKRTKSIAEGQSAEFIIRTI